MESNPFQESPMICRPELEDKVELQQKSTAEPGACNAELEMELNALKNNLEVATKKCSLRSFSSTARVINTKKRSFRS